MHRFTCGLLPVLLLAAAPAFARTDPAHFTGVLTNDAPRVHQASVYFDADGPGDTPVEQMTREQLQAEYRRLDNNRPSLVLGIVLTAAGGGALLGGIVLGAYGIFVGYLFTGVDSIVQTLGWVIAIVAGAAFVAGCILLPIGLVKLFHGLSLRRAYGARMDDVNARLEQLDRGGYPPPAPGNDLTPPPPPPPPPPPGALWQGPQPSMVLASF
jgi:hypothetical protein